MNTNTLTFKELSEIIEILEFNNISLNESFDYFRIIGLNENYEKNAKNILFFFPYCNEKDRNGWYTKPFDVREKTEIIINNNPKYTFVIEKEQIIFIKSKDTKYIVVDNINNAIDLLFEYFNNIRKAKTIAITGSVGKTTCIGLLETVLKKNYNILRIYSKRVTPIILKANIINFLTVDIDYIVMEFSIYYHDHVEIFTDYLKPFIAGIIDIDSSHMGIDLLNTTDDICIYKSKILKYAEYGLINNNDEYLKNLILKDNSLYYANTFILKNDKMQLEKLDLKDIEVLDNKFSIENITWKPFILSNLAKIQYYTVYKIAKILNINNSIIQTGFTEYLPVENRIHEEVAFGKKIIFDGDITTYERIKELSNNYYENKYLVLRKVGSSENTLRISNIKEFFKNYKKVYIFQDVEYLPKLLGSGNIEIVNNHDFMHNIDGTIIYHYSGYYRVFNDFNEQNLNIYDNTIYKVIMED